MKLVAAGRHVLNLEFLIRHEVNDGSPEAAQIPAGTVRVTMAPGVTIDLHGPAADAYLKAVADTLDTPAAPTTITASRPIRVRPRHRINPPTASGKRKKRG